MIVVAVIIAKRRAQREIEVEVTPEPAPPAAIPVGPPGPTYPPATPVVATSLPPPPPPPEYYSQPTYAQSAQYTPPPLPPRAIAHAVPETSPVPMDEFQIKFDRVEKVLQATPLGGTEIKRARSFLKLARTFYNRGDTEKAHQYLAKAESFTNKN